MPSQLEKIERARRPSAARAHGPLLSFLLARLARVRYVSQPQSKPVSSRAALVLRAQLPLSCSFASSLTRLEHCAQIRMQRVEDKDKGTRAYSATKTAAAPMPARTRERGTSVSKAEDKERQEAEGEREDAPRPMHMDVTRILPPRRRISCRPVATWRAPVCGRKEERVSGRLEERKERASEDARSREGGRGRWHHCERRRCKRVRLGA